MADIVRFFAQIVQDFQLEKGHLSDFNPLATVEMDNIATPITIKPYACNHVARAPKSY